MKLLDDRLLLSRERSELDRDVIEFTSVLDENGVDYVIVSGYVAILTGRSRSTEDIDIVLGSLSESQLDQLADRLEMEGYWGLSMPLEKLSEMLTDGDRVRIAEEEELYPNFELWLASNDVEREALSTAIEAELGDDSVTISSIELQIAYKLRLAQGTGSTNGKDFEDALHLYLTFEDQWKRDQLETYVERLGVEDYYAELQGI